MGKPRPTDAYFPENPQLSRVVQDIFDLLTDDTDTVYDDADVLAGIAANLAVLATKLQAATYTEKWENITHAVDITWTDVDLSGYGVLAGDICEIWLWADGVLDQVGARTDGSAIDRKCPAVAQEPQLTMQVVAGTGSIIEVWLEDASGSRAYLAGYWRFSTT